MWCIFHVPMIERQLPWLFISDSYNNRHNNDILFSYTVHYHPCISSWEEKRIDPTTAQVKSVDKKQPFFTSDDTFCDSVKNIKN